jgi:hypothetical protein
MYPSYNCDDPSMLNQHIINIGHVKLLCILLYFVRCFFHNGCWKRNIRAKIKKKLNKIKNHNYYGSSSSVQQKAAGGRRNRESTTRNMVSNLTYIR